MPEESHEDFTSDSIGELGEEIACIQPYAGKAIWEAEYGNAEGTSDSKPAYKCQPIYQTIFVPSLR